MVQYRKYHSPALDTILDGTVHLPSSQLIPLRTILMLFCYLLPVLEVGVLSRGFPANILYSLLACLIDSYTKYLFVDFISITSESYEIFVCR
jgi:hypothetical protein